MLDTPNRFRSLFSSLIDDGSMSPPASRPLEQALDMHRQHRASWYSSFIGPFLCPVSRLSELVAMLPADERLLLSLVVDTEADAVRRALDVVACHPRLAFAGLEARHSQLGTAALTLAAGLSRAHPAAQSFLEVGGYPWNDTFAAVIEGGWSGVMYRTGGGRADDFPAESALAAMVVRCVGSRTPFKLTGGLNHLVRGLDATLGVPRHGVLNVLAGVAEARAGGDLAAVAELLRSCHVDHLLARLTVPHAVDERQYFRSFGCCDVLDPLREAIELGLIATRHGGRRESACPAISQ